MSVHEITTKSSNEQSFFVNTITSLLRRFGGGSFGISPDGKRDYNKIYGYGESLTYNDFYGMYDRGGIANVIVEKMAKACWGELPKIKANDDEILTDEILALNNVGFFSALQRADILNRIGNFSVLVIGLGDGLDLDKPLGKVSSNEINDQLYFNPYNYDGITIKSNEIDPESPRYGLPKIYQLSLTTTAGSKDVTSNSVLVHYSRVIHLAEGALDSKIEGRSALRAPWNALIDVEKVRGGAGEAYFKNARTQRVLEAGKDARLEKDSDAMKTLKENLDEFDQGWSNTLRLQNMTSKHMPVSMISPRDTFDIAVETISGQTGIPIRILTGVGGGQTTGSEDRATWNSLVIDRRNDFCNNALLQGLTILSNAGFFDLPDNASVEYPPQRSTNEKDQAVVNKTKAETLKIVIEALNRPVGDEADIDTVLETVGLEDIEINTDSIKTHEPEPKNKPTDLSDPDLDD